MTRFLLEWLLWTWLMSLVYFYDEETVDEVVWKWKFRAGIVICPMIGFALAWLIRV